MDSITVLRKNSLQTLLKKLERKDYLPTYSVRSSIALIPKLDKESKKAQINTSDEYRTDQQILACQIQ